MQPDKALNHAASFLGDRNQIMALAEDYWTVIAHRDATEERVFLGDFREARDSGYLSKDLFMRVARWKSRRNTRRYDSNTEAEIRLATATAFRAPDDASALGALMRLDGVALRTASAILHWMRPESFPILDFRVMAALGHIAPKSYDVPLYTRISDQIRELALRHSLDLRTIDRALWTWDKRRALASRGRCAGKRA
ncbi:MAG: hypothetical protein HY735_11560 [Verrucomicrobia bacterium]|nr:hypothetical protein [Verrucomicrobiota bacterium]